MTKIDIMAATGDMFGRPLMMDERAATGVVSRLMNMSGADVLASLGQGGGEAEAYKAAAGQMMHSGPIDPDYAMCWRYGHDEKVYYVEGGVAVIPFSGLVVPHSNWWNGLLGLVSVEAFKMVMLSALADPDVKAVMVIYNSPGGAVTGVFDAVDALYEAKQTSGKKIFGHANETANSAAYAFASLSDHLSAPRTGNTGSVGVIAMYLEYSKYLKQEGIQVNVFRSLDEKARVSAYEELSEKSRAAIQADVEEIFDIFKMTALRNRPSLSERNLVSSESRSLMSAEALRLGFIDDVMSLGEAVVYLGDNI